VTSEGLDGDALAGHYPTGDWLPLTGPALAPELTVSAELNGHQVDALLDTGSTYGFIGEQAARNAGVIRSDRWLARSEIWMQGHAVAADAYRAELRLGKFAFHDVRLNVIPGSNFGLVVGLAVLGQLDVFAAAGDRTIGLFEAGRGPVPAGARALEFVEHADGVAYVEAFVLAPGRDRYQPAVRLLIDTGATTTGIPLPALAGQRRMSDDEVETGDGKRHAVGRYDVGELIVGRRHLPVGSILPHASSVDYGSLGLDVWRRYHALFSARRAQIFLAPRPRRPELRTLGPGGAPCLRNGAATPCIAVRLGQQLRPATVCATVAPGYGGQPLALEIDAERADGSQAWGGGRVTIYLRGAAHWQIVCEKLSMDLSRDRTWDFARLALNRVYRPREFPCGNRSSCVASCAPLP